MPFISKDWRSPGEAWVKTEEGWEKMKVLECSRRRRHPAITSYNNTEQASLLEHAWSGCAGREEEAGEGEPGREPPPPHCHITIKCTREIAGFNGLSEAVRRLDFPSAVRDVRRFNYICALLSLLLTGHKLTHLPGAAQKLLLSMLEEVAAQVAESQQNTGALRALLGAVAAAREGERSACWGRPLGSRALWGHHDHTIARIQRIATSTQAHPTEPGLQALPEECVREILLRLADHRDLESSSRAYSVMEAVCGEARIWRELCRAHFSTEQIERESSRQQQRDQRDQHAAWRTLYHTLRKAYGLREEVQYAETLSLCRHCKCLFWRSLGHPCIADQCPEYRQRLRDAGGPLPPHPVPPAAFLKFFSL